MCLPNATSPLPGTRAQARILVYLLALSVAAWMSPAHPALETHRLELNEIDGLENGRLTLVEGESTPDGHGFLLENLSILQPVAVTLFTADPEPAVDVTLAKYHWDNGLRSASTVEGTPVTFRIRTQGELRILVSGARPQPYKLLVWTGDEVEPPMEPVVVSMDRYESRNADGGGFSTFQWMVVSLLAAILAVLGLIAFRRMSR